MIEVAKATNIEIYISTISMYQSRFMMGFSWCNVAIAIINHPPVITILMVGIPTINNRRSMTLLYPHYPVVNNKNYGKSSFFMAISTISMAIFHSYFDITRGYNPIQNPIKSPFSYGFPMVFPGNLTSCFTPGQGPAASAVSFRRWRRFR